MTAFTSKPIQTKAVFPLLWSRILQLELKKDGAPRGLVMAPCGWLMPASSDQSVDFQCIFNANLSPKSKKKNKSQDGIIISIDVMWRITT